MKAMEAVENYIEGMVGELLSGTWGVPPEYRVLYRNWFAKHAQQLAMLIEAAGEGEDEGEVEIEGDPEEGAPSGKPKKKAGSGVRK